MIVQKTDVQKHKEGQGLKEKEIEEWHKQRGKEIELFSSSQDKNSINKIVVNWAHCPLHKCMKWSKGCTHEK